MIQRLDYNINCMQQQEHEKIKFLENKVRLLEREISERVRSFLLFANKNTKSPLKNNSRERQTQTSIQSQREVAEAGSQTQPINGFPFYDENLLKQSGVSFFEQDLESPIALNEKAAESPGMNSVVSEFATTKEDRVQSDPQKQKPAIRINLIQVQQNNKSCMQSQRQQQTKESKDLNQSEFYARERKKMRREIKKLREKLEYQVEVSTEAKEGLLISEEENYAFRMKISQLTKALEEKSKNESLNEEDEKEISPIQKGKIEQTSCECKQLKELKPLLQNQNEALKDRLRQIQSRLCQKNCGEEDKNEHQKITQTSDQTLFKQKLKDILYQITNVMPTSGELAQLSMFRPQNQAEILSILAKMQSYFERASEESDRALQIRVNQKKLFIDLLAEVRDAMDDQSKRNALCKIRERSDFISYLKIFQE